MKLFKILFGRGTFIIISIILQLALLGLFLFEFQGAYIYFGISMTILSFLVLIKIINKNYNPSNILPWIVLVVGLPIVGGMLYCLFGENRWGKRQKKKIKKLTDKTVEFYKQEEISLLEDDNYTHCKDHNNYIMKTTGCPCFTNTKTKYFPNGESFLEGLLDDLKQAKNFIFMEYFIIDKGEMWDRIEKVLIEKAKEGVEVCILYDDVGTIYRLPNNFDKKLKKYGIKAYKFNKFLPVVSVFHNNRDHRKITVVDGKVGYTGGINIADEYINVIKPFGYWKDTAVRLEGDGVKNLTVLFLHMLDVTTKEDIDYLKYLNSEKSAIQEEGVVQPFGTGPKPFYEKQVGENIYINLINQAKKYVYITTPYVICDYFLINTIINAVDRGVDVRIVIPNIPDRKIIYWLTQSNCKELLKAGAKIYKYTPGFIHAKSILCDDESSIIGTINFDYRSLLHHFEDGVFMYKTSAINELKDDFERNFEESELMTEKDVRFGFFKRVFVSLIRIFSPML